MSKQENKEHYSVSDLLSLPTVWDVWTDMYACGIFPVRIDVQESWTPPVWLTATFFPLDINAKRALMLHSRQLEKLEYDNYCKGTPIDVQQVTLVESSNQTLVT